MSKLIVSKCDICNQNIALNVIKATNPELTQGLLYQYKVCYKCADKIHAAIQEMRRNNNDN